MSWPLLLFLKNGEFMMGFKPIPQVLNPFILITAIFILMKVRRLAYELVHARVTRITKKTYIEPKASLAHLADSNKPKDSIL
jgi:hypothetical protein